MLRRAMLAAQLPQAHNPMLLTRVSMLQLPLVMQRSPVMPLVLRVVLLLNILKTLSTQILIQLLNHNQRLLVVPLQLLLVQQAQHLLLQKLLVTLLQAPPLVIKLDPVLVIQPQSRGVH